MPKRTSSFRDDLLADLADPEEAVQYLNASLEDSAELFLVALRDVAEANQMAKVAGAAGVARESVYRMLAAKGNPTYASLLGILRAVGLKMAIAVDAPNAVTEATSRSAEYTQAGTFLGVSTDAANENCVQNRISGSTWVPRKDMRTAIASGGSLSQPHLAASAT
ncbi:MAG: addiction module antidote protein [Bryobacteraceae bacterium]